MLMEYYFIYQLRLIKFLVFFVGGLVMEGTLLTDYSIWVDYFTVVMDSI